MSTDTYPYRYNFDAHMIQRANARGSAHMTGRGMVLHDEVIVNGGSGPGGHNIETPKRARRAHSKLLVFTWGNR